MASMQADIVIVGSGPTGLGAAARMHQHNVRKQQVCNDHFHNSGCLLSLPILIAHIYLSLMLA